MPDHKAGHAARNLPSLTSLRALAALSVFAYHLDRWDVWEPTSFLSMGYVGVGFFFVLSGFVLGWGTSPGTKVRAFYRRRFARVYPSHLVMLLVAVVAPVVAVSASPTAAVAGMSLLQAWSSDPAIAYGMNGVSWSLSCEAVFYAAFPLAMVLLRGASRPLRWAVPAVWLATTALVLILARHDDGTLDLVFHFPLARAGEFLLGLVAALEIRDGWRPRVKPLPAVILLIAVVLISRRLPFPAPNVSLAVPFLLVIVAVAQADLEGRSGRLAKRTLRYAGEVSFAFYLVHELIIINLAPTVSVPAPIEALLVLVASIIAAVALHHTVERPLQARLRGPERVSTAPC